MLDHHKHVRQTKSGDNGDEEIADNDWLGCSGREVDQRANRLPVGDTDIEVDTRSPSGLTSESRSFQFRMKLLVQWKSATYFGKSQEIPIGRMDNGAM
jgi:hypothetical protein